MGARAETKEEEMCGRKDEGKGWALRDGEMKESREREGKNSGRRKRPEG